MSASPVSCLRPPLHRVAKPSLPPSMRAQSMRDCCTPLFLDFSAGVAGWNFFHMVFVDELLQRGQALLEADDQWVVGIVLWSHAEIIVCAGQAHGIG